MRLTGPCLRAETVHNAGTPEESYADSVLINSRNIKSVELVESVETAGQVSGEGALGRGPEEMIREYAMGDMSRFD